MKNLKLKVKNENKKYSFPEIEVVELNVNDVITTSPGTETPWYEESDGIWSFEVTP